MDPVPSTEVVESSSATQEPQSFPVLGVRVHAVQIPDAVALFQDWISERGSTRYVAVTGMHGVTEAQHDAGFKEILNAADLVVSDGMPLVWLGRRKGFPMARRVYGPELMTTFCAEASRTYKHFLYGGSPEVVERLAEVLRERYQLRIVGVHSPPFRPLTSEESIEITRLINDSRADVVWVGLSTPKQERWMYEHRHLLRAPLAVGVGAAFDLVAGVKKMAPRWMQERGLEWLYRLVQEPRRLWRRYLVGGTKFLTFLALERLKLRNFDARPGP
jgi:N-acetylglucosaminyldiphosphoundecaprenol N-acetyl-beta-D-mannosaminyltransferase